MEKGGKLIFERGMCIGVPECEVKYMSSISAARQRVHALLDEKVGPKEPTLEKYTWEHAAQRLLKVMMTTEQG